MGILKDIQIIELLDIYGELLTERQLEILKMHYHFDISISEIAENLNITRQSVKDCIDKCKSQLTEFEEKLKFLEKEQETNCKLEKILELNEVNDIKKELQKLL